MNYGKYTSVIVTWLLLLMFGLLGLFLFWSIYPYKPIEFKDKVFKIETPIVEQGGILSYKSNYCKYMDIPATVNRLFINGLIFEKPSSVASRDVGCHTVDVGVLVPSELPSGEYFLRNIFTYKVNPIREVIIVKDTEIFKVIE